MRATVGRDCREPCWDSHQGAPSWPPPRLPARHRTAGWRSTSRSRGRYGSGQRRACPGSCPGSRPDRDPSTWSTPRCVSMSQGVLLAGRVRPTGLCDPLLRRRAAFATKGHALTCHPSLARVDRSRVLEGSPTRVSTTSSSGGGCALPVATRSSLRTRRWPSRQELLPAAPSGE